jgi:hypothetical protein
VVLLPSFPFSEGWFVRSTGTVADDDDDDVIIDKYDDEFD